MATEIIRPNGDKVTTNWTKDGAGDYYEDIDETHSEPSDEGDGVEIHTATHNAYYCCSLANMSAAKGTDIITAITIHALGRFEDYDEGDASLAECKYRLGDAGGWSSSKVLTYSQNPATESWEEQSWTGLSLTKADIDDLQIAFVYTVIMGGPMTLTIDVAYAEITYTETTLTQSDVIDGTIVQSEMGYAKGEFRLKEGTTILNDNPIQITEDYTDDGTVGTSNRVIFDGYIVDHTLEDVKTVQCVSKQAEVARIQPLGYYQGLITANLSRMIEDHADQITATDGPTTWTGYWNAPFNFSNQGGLTDDDIDFVDTISGISATISDYDDGDTESGSDHNDVLTMPMNGTGDYIKHEFGEHKESGICEFWIATDDVSDTWAFQFKSDAGFVSCYFAIDNADSKLYYWDGSSKTLLSATALLDDDWYRIKVTWYNTDTWDLIVYTHDLVELGGVGNGSMSGADFFTTPTAPSYIKLYTNTVGVHTVYLDAIGFDWDGSYTVGDNAIEIKYNLPVSTKLRTQNLNGGQSLQSLLTEGAILENYVWTLDPDMVVKWTDGTSVLNTGATDVIFDGTQNVWGVRAKQQIQRINKVVLKGAGGLEATAEDTDLQAASGQINIFKDYRADISNQSELDTMATQILTKQKTVPLSITMSVDWEAVGYLQPSYNVTIQADKIKYNNSSSYIPADDYRITQITYHIKDGAYDYIELAIVSGIYYNKQLPEEERQQNMHNANQSYGGQITSGSGINSVSADSSPQLGGDLDLNGFNIDFPTTANISDCLDEDNMASNSATKLATQRSIKAYADLKATDAEAHAYVEANALTLENNLDMGGNQITNVGNVDGKDVSGLCTTAEAVQAVEDTGLVLSSTKVITSADEDLNFTLGRVGLGFDGLQNDQAIFAHRDMVNDTDFALKQDNLGNTILNTKAAKEMFFSVNDSEVAAINSSGLILGNANARVTTIYDQDNMAANSNTALATQQSIKAYADGLQPTYNYEALDLLHDGSAAFDNRYIEMNLVNEYVGSNFYVNADVDASADLVFTFVWSCTSADASVAGRKYVSCIETDGTEAYAWNVENGSVENLDSTTADRWKTWTYTLAAANFAAGDWVCIVWRLNEASRVVRFYSGEVRYTIA